MPDDLRFVDEEGCPVLVLYYPVPLRTASSGPLPPIRIQQITSNEATSSLGKYLVTVPQETP